jgi:hypothetical protein
MKVIQETVNSEQEMLTYSEFMSSLQGLVGFVLLNRYIYNLFSGYERIIRSRKYNTDIVMAKRMGTKGLTMVYKKSLKIPNTTQSTNYKYND